VEYKRQLCSFLSGVDYYRMVQEDLREASYSRPSFLEDDAVAMKVLEALSESHRTCCADVAAALNAAADLPEHEIIVEAPKGDDNDANRNVEMYGEKQGEQLAVAVAVFDASKQHTDEDGYLPSAVEYDPESKGKDSQEPFLSRRFLLRVCAGAAVLLVGATVVVCTTITVQAHKKNGPHHRLTLGIQEQVERLVGSENLVDTTSPHRKALEWITFNDPTEPIPEDSNFLQRYVAACFYYATSMEQEWGFCAPPREYDSNDCTFMLSLSLQSNDDETLAKSGYRWLSEPNECLWAGVACNADDQIEAIELGTLVWELLSQAMVLMLISHSFLFFDLQTA
jgi:hypothetical protein